MVVISLLVGIIYLMNDTEDEVPVRVRVSLAHAGIGIGGEDAMRSGLILPSPLEAVLVPRTFRMDYPMGSEHGALTYNARTFREAEHLGDDLNGIGGGNSDLGDPIYAAGDGLVVYAANASEGWGNVVIVQHRDAAGHLFQTFYAHLKEIHVNVGDWTWRGRKLGLTGDANGRYLAHLHLEWRDTVSLDTGAGYSPFDLDRRPPEASLRNFRQAPPEMLNKDFTALVQELMPERRLEWDAKDQGFKFEEKEDSAREPRQ